MKEVLFSHVNLQLLGLIFDIIGAYFVVRSFIVKKPADIKAETYGNTNQELFVQFGMSGNLWFSFYIQGIEARIGLVLLILGFVFQALGIFPLSIPFYSALIILVSAIIISTVIYLYLTNPERIRKIHDRDERDYDNRLKGAKK